MSAILTSQGVVVATAMAVSGTFILLALRLQKNLPATQFSDHPTPLPRSCISSGGILLDGKRGKKKKRVHFAEGVVDPIGNSEDFRRQHKANYMNTPVLELNSPIKNRRGNRKMPENRAALYQGMLKNRVDHQRFAYSY